MKCKMLITITDYSQITQTEANIRHVNIVTREIFYVTFKTRERMKLLEREAAHHLVKLI